MKQSNRLLLIQLLNPQPSGVPYERVLLEGANMKPPSDYLSLWRLSIFEFWRDW